jgi:Ser/Thr protein kinase RdoA (MazF antagonist)
MIDAEAVARQASRRYGFGDDARLGPFGELTENPTFRVEENGTRDPVALRIYRPHGRPAAEIRSELAWISALRDEAGVPTPAVIVALDGATVVEVDGLFAAAFEVVPGREAGEDDLGWLMDRIGELTAALHNHADGWRPPAWFERPRWDVRTTLGDLPHWGRWQDGVADSEQRAQLERVAQVVSRRLRDFGEGRSRFGLIHADLRAANVIVDGGEVSVIDFDDCGSSWYLYDLAATLTFYEATPNVDELIARWADSYRRIRPLADEDEREIRTFLMLRRLMVSAFVGSRNDTALAEELRADGFDDTTCRLAETYLSEFS